MAAQPTQKCPICNSDTFQMQRYPNYVCNGCITRYGTRTHDNKKIEFGNVNVFGGFQSKIEGENEYGDVHVCYINEIKCYANEARFGGIVIQPSPDNNNMP